MLWKFQIAFDIKLSWVLQYLLFDPDMEHNPYISVMVSPILGQLFPISFDTTYCQVMSLRGALA